MAEWRDGQLESGRAIKSPGLVKDIRAIANSEQSFLLGLMGSGGSRTFLGRLPSQTRDLPRSASP